MRIASRNIPFLISALGLFLISCSREQPPETQVPGPSARQLSDSSEMGVPGPPETQLPSPAEEQVSKPS